MISFHPNYLRKDPSPNAVTFSGPEGQDFNICILRRGPHSAPGSFPEEMLLELRSKR